MARPHVAITPRQAASLRFASLAAATALVVLAPALRGAPTGLGPTPAAPAEVSASR